MPNDPAISIAVSTVQGWPAVSINIATLEAAAAAAGGEVIVADGSGLPVPTPGELAATTMWKSVPGASIFQLRDMAYRLTRGSIVAITEDHCRVPLDWATSMVEAHRAHPEAVAVGGSVENGATTNDIDWASFLVVQAPIASPIVSGPAEKIAGAVNVSYKREALERIDDFDGLGALDVLHQRSLRRSGGILVADDGIQVVHDQSLGLRGTVVLHYHAGRTFAGFLRRRMDAIAWLRLVGVLIIPYVRFGRAVAIGSGKGYGHIIGRVWPAMLLLFLVQGAGQFVGFVAGPGDSPRRVQ
jgi:hypothetical protein